MTGLKSAARRFQSVIHKENGLPFHGTIMPVDEGKISAFDFSSPRLLLRTTTYGVVKARDIILDDLDRRFIVANHGYSPQGGHFVFRLYQVIADLALKRQQTARDPLTGLSRGVGQDDLGMIPCMVEMTGREFPDQSMRVAEETRRIITSAELRLGDQVDDAIVRRIDTALGVTYAEIR